MPALAVVKVGRYHRTTISRKVRKLLGTINENDEIRWVFEDNKVIIGNKGERQVKCPYCNYKAYENDFKSLRKPWRFWFYTVEKLECPKCYGISNYYGISPRTNKIFGVQDKDKV